MNEFLGVASAAIILILCECGIFYISDKIDAWLRK